MALEWRDGGGALAVKRVIGEAKRKWGWIRRAQRHALPASGEGSRLGGKLEVKLKAADLGDRTQDMVLPQLGRSWDMAPGCWKHVCWQLVGDLDARAWQVGASETSPV